jgi:hypothetical protein
MRLTFAVLSSAAAMAALLALPAEAQTRRHGANLDQPTRITTTDETGRRRTRITVRRRSFLDPGTESKTFDRHYHDYAVPPGYSVFHDRNDWKGSWSRMPLPGAYDVPGWR